MMERLLKNSQIWKYAGPSDKLPDTPADVIHHDLDGKFIMPGMTETHAHLSFADCNLERNRCDILEGEHRNTLVSRFS